jgi:hypothetical protein
MLIVSQDKKQIINFDRVERIQCVNNDGQKKFMEKSNLDIFAPIIKETTGIDFTELKDYGIYTYFSNGQSIIIGQYETEERAQEVLQEIIKTCTCWENFKYGIAEGIGTPKYEMPKK